MNEHRTLPTRRIWIAALFSLFGTGVGHLYAGRARRGLFLCGLTLLFVPVCLVVSQQAPSLAGLWAMIAAVALVLVTYLMSIFDAMSCASRAARPYVSHPCNHAALYVLLALVGTGWVVGGAALVRVSAFEAFKIPTSSMAPTLVDGDRVFVNKQRALDLEYGAIVVFRAPEDPGVMWIKRVVGLAGDTLEFRNGWMQRNGAPVLDPRAPHTRNGKLVVPPGQVYVMGDNREGSKDSRDFGPISAGSIVGTAEYVFPRRGLPRTLD